ncbi:hypothetical protein GCM10007304_17420 [Rhodococcoides trifolii]|uniref:Uncharacterized protein n=2 Tax=Rhodococcoides trifolii TaxID=908250 RepID=A0A917CZW7_9NOCA|nr:hypothetical protein GCM10007304_17420 [Rhodococcus trifolii]
MEFLQYLYPGATTFVQAVSEVFPFTTEDQAQSFVGYAIGLCAVEENAGAGVVESLRETTPVEFEKNYGLAITQDVANVVVDRYGSVCEEG